MPEVQEEREGGREVRSGAVGRVEADGLDDGMASDLEEEEMQVAQELMAVDSDDSDSPPASLAGNTNPPPQEPGPGIRQVLEPVTFSMDFTFQLPPPAQRERSRLLQALFGLLGGQDEDPGRARTIVRGLEAVGEGMVTRLVKAEEGTCAVCMDSIEESEPAEVASSPAEPTSSSPALPRIVALPCAHVFHTACLTPWLARQTTCPNCRFDVDPESLTVSAPPRAPFFAHLLPPVVTSIRRRDEGPTQPGPGPLLSLFATQFADILQSQTQPTPAPSGTSNSIQIFPLTPGQAPPPPPPGTSFVDLVFPGGGAQPFAMHPPTTAAGVGEMGQGGFLNGLFGEIASALMQAPSTTSEPSSTATEPAAHIAPDGTLALTSDTQATRAEQAQPRRTDSPARARTARVVSGSVPSVARVNPSGPSTPQRTSIGPDTPAPAEASSSAPASVPAFSVRDDHLPIAALPFPIPVPDSVTVPLSDPRAIQPQGQGAPLIIRPQTVAQSATQQPAQPQHTSQQPVQQPQLPAQPQSAPAQTAPNRAGFHFTPLTGPGGRTLGGILTFTPHLQPQPQPQPPVFVPAPPPGHAAAAAQQQPQPQPNPFSSGPAPGGANPSLFGSAPSTAATGVTALPTALQDMMSMAMMGVPEGERAEIRPVAPLPRRAMSVPPAAQAAAQEGAQGRAEGGTTLRVEINVPNQSRPALRRKWAPPPPPPGPTLRQRVEASERARSARCDALSCVYAPSDERPEGEVGGALKGVEGCAHMFHAGCMGEKCVVCRDEDRDGKECIREGKRKREV